MRIVVNAVAANMGGAVRHLTNFARALGEIDCEREYLFCVDDELLLPATAPNVRFQRVRAPRQSFLHRLYWDQVSLPRLATEQNAGLLLSLLNFGPIHLPVRQIVFQRNSIYFCRYYLDHAHGKANALLRRALLKRVMDACESIVTPTAAMREMIRGVYPQIPMEKFRVIPHGFDREEFLRGAPAPKPTDCMQLLYATHPANYKGFEILLNAMRLVLDAGVNAQLSLTADLTADRDSGVEAYPRLIEQLQLQDAVRFLGRVPQDQIAQVYRASDLFVFPSLCESFGFPLVEAMSAGLPIIAADTPVNREMCADAAAYYSPLDARGAARQIVRIAGDKTQAEALVRNARARMESYDWSWRRYAREVTELF